MTRRQFSSEFTNYRRTLRCPQGHRHSLTFVEGTGQRVQDMPLRDRLMLENPRVNLESTSHALQFIGRLRQANHDRMGGMSIHQFRVDSAFTCDLCGQRWSVFEQPHVQVVSDRPTGRTQTQLGSDLRELDTAGATDHSKVVLTFSCEWMERIEVRWERLSSRESGLSASVKTGHGPFEVGAGAQTKVSESLSASHLKSSETKRVLVQSVELSLPPGRINRVRITWKQVWQEYECTLRITGVGLATLPYRVAVEPSFDLALLGPGGPAPVPTG